MDIEEMRRLAAEREAAKRSRDREIARSIVALEETEGWKHFTKIAEALIEANIPNISQFSDEGATLIASQIAFVSGIKRCLGLIKQQKDILSSLTEK